MPCVWALTEPAPLKLELQVVSHLTWLLGDEPGSPGKQSYSKLLKPSLLPNGIEFSILLFPSAGITDGSTLLRSLTLHSSNVLLHLLSTRPYSGFLSLRSERLVSFWLVFGFGFLREVSLYTQKRPEFVL